MSDWLITCQQPIVGFEPGNTFYVCMDHLSVLAMAYLQSQQAADELGPDEEPEGPGVLEQIEQDEGAQGVAGGNGRSRKSSKPAEPDQTDATEEQAASADVNG